MTDLSCGPASGSVLALDIGGTKLAAGLVEPDTGTITQFFMAPTPRGDAEQVWRAIAGLIRPLLGARPRAIGAGCPGPLSTADGTVSPVNIPGWRGFPLRERLTGLAGAPVTVANDAICAAVGEHRRGSGQGAAAMLGMVVSTGVGGGFILDGFVYGGPTGNAGNIGHAIADPDGEPCPCGGVGCVETIASGPSMVRRARAAGWPGPPDATATDLAAAAAQADPSATAAVAAAAHALAIAIVSAAVLVDLDVVVIGGGVAAFGDLLLAPLTKECLHYGRNAFARRLQVRLASLSGPEAGLIGAAVLAATAGNRSSVSGSM